MKFYNLCTQFQEIIRCVYLLAFVPHEDGVFVYNQLIVKSLATQTDEWPQGAKLFITKYVKSSWVGTHRSPARFPVAMWNMWRTFSDNLPSTNNAVESNNRSWNLSLGSKPSIWKVIRGFKRENLLASKKRTELITGELVDTNPGGKPKVALLRNRRVTAMKTYQRKELDQYLVVMHKLV